MEKNMVFTNQPQTNPEYFQNLSAITDLKELPDETAATCSGGSLKLYDTADFKGLLGTYPLDSRSSQILGINKASSIIIDDDSKWRIYSGRKGDTQISRDFTKGKYVLPPELNNNVSGAQRIA
jgi:hypothetical protein